MFLQQQQSSLCTYKPIMNNTVGIYFTDLFSVLNSEHRTYSI